MRVHKMRVMVALVSGCIAMVLLGAGVLAQLRPPTVEFQRGLEERARLNAEEVSDRARATMVGSLRGTAARDVRLWHNAVRLWRREKNASAALMLAEGVLVDCVGRLQGVTTQLVSSEVPRPPPFANLATQRPGRAAKLFDDALKRDPTLIEARMRAARIRAIDDPGDTKAVSLLETIAADDKASPFNYLAAVSRAEVARAKADREGAITWYERARTLHPRSASAAIALSSLVPGRTVAFGTLDADDPYYTYPCTVLTAEVAAALSTWIQAVPRWPK